MAITVVETRVDTNSSATYLTINTNTFAALAVGDLMIAQFFIGTTGATITLPSGWTEIIKTENAGDNLTSQISYKVADSGDVTGNSLTFDKGVGSAVLKLHITQISGQRAASVISASSGQANDSTATITAPTVTPVEAGSMILFYTCTNTSSGSVSSYSIATSSPSFTEVFDNNNNNFVASMAYGVRPEVTATGSGTATSSGSGGNIGQLVVVCAPQSFTITDTVTATDTKYLNIGALIAEIITITDTFTSTVARLWTKVTRNIKTWTNQDR